MVRQIGGRQAGERECAPCAAAPLRQQGDREGIAWLTNQLGDVARRMGDDVKAEARYQDALAMFKKIGHRRRVNSQQVQEEVNLV